MYQFRGSFRSTSFLLIPRLQPTLAVCFGPEREMHCGAPAKLTYIQTDPFGDKKVYRRVMWPAKFQACVHTNTCLIGELSSFDAWDKRGQSTNLDRLAVDE